MYSKCQYTRTLGWSDFVLFLDFQNWAHCCQSNIFLEVHCQKIGDFCHAPMRRLRSEAFTFKKSQGPSIFFILNLRIPSFYFKEQRPKRKFGIKLFNIFLGPQSWQHQFCPWGRKFFFFLTLPSVFAFKQAEEQIQFQVQPLQMVNK